MNHKIALVDFLNEDPFLKAVSFILLLLLLLILFFKGGGVEVYFQFEIILQVFQSTALDAWTYRPISTYHDNT